MDTNSRGLTPLFFAAQSGSVEACRFLISLGADAEAHSFTNDLVASYACLTLRVSDGQGLATASRSCEDHIATIRMFIDHLDFEDYINCTGLTASAAYSARDAAIQIARIQHLSHLHSIEYFQYYKNSFHQDGSSWTKLRTTYLWRDYQRG
ncbi:hypothetical protein B0J14DRAFT_587390 [Halenospora varia]|nr:hypothetical protein B0J14DRAFT_587390 [Halenospora varia]